MEILSCGHAQVSASVRLCTHLIDAKVVNKYGRCLRGVGLEFDAACIDCSARFEKGEGVHWVEVCAACYEEFADNGWYFFWVGNAQILAKPTLFESTIIERRLVVAEKGVFCIAGDERVFMFADGQLSEVGKENQILLSLELPFEPEPDWNHIHLRPRLEVSKMGRFAALVNDFGRYGVVVDLEERAIILNLDRGDYHPEQTPFPLAFFQSAGHEMIVHGTDWNRLDISDLQTGELLSMRESPIYETNVRPDHYLNYFHGRLQISPDENWILDDGWIWHPMGIPTWWSLRRWSMENIWESEDGSSRVDPIYRESWNAPMCWIDNRRVIISGIGGDDGEMISGVRIFDLSGKEIFAFAGPRGEFFSDVARLFSVEDNGMQIWDVETGARTETIAGFCPHFQIEGALVEIKIQTLRRWNYGS